MAEPRLFHAVVVPVVGQAGDLGEYLFADVRDRRGESSHGVTSLIWWVILSL